MSFFQSILNVNVGLKLTASQIMPTLTFLFNWKKDTHADQYTPSSRRQVQDTHLFSISPRSGTLLPGQQRAVHFSYRSEAQNDKGQARKNANICTDESCLKTAAFNFFIFILVVMRFHWKHDVIIIQTLSFYSHDFAGMSRFPVVFKLSHGREILVRQKSMLIHLIN